MLLQRYAALQNQWYVAWYLVPGRDPNYLNQIQTQVDSRARYPDERVFDAGYKRACGGAHSCCGQGG